MLIAYADVVHEEKVESFIIVNHFLYITFFPNERDMWHAWNDKCIQNFVWTLWEATTWENFGFDEKNILELTLKKWYVSVESIHAVQVPCKQYLLTS